MSEFGNFPRQTLSFKSKTKAWRKKCVEWANNKTYFNQNLIRKTVNHKMINYNLINGILNMNDLQLIVNPSNIEAGYIPDKIQHYPIMNSKLNLIRGEESARLFDYKAVVTNPNGISQVEEDKKNEVLQRFQMILQNQSQSEEEFQANMQKLSDFSTFEYQDMREMRANALLKHYVKELNLSSIFNKGIMDGMIVGEEIYRVSIVGGEPFVEKLHPNKIRAYKSGYSSHIEDADIIIYEDYWSPGRVIDTFYDVLTPQDIKYIEEVPNNIDEGVTDSMDNIDERWGFVRKDFFGEEGINVDELFTPNGVLHGFNSSLMPYDLAGNIRVLQVYWKSRRKIKKVTSYNPETGEKEINFYPETYIANTDMGEEEENYWINEAWEGTMIGSDIFVNMRPCPIQYNRLSNPSKCHFGIIGEIYTAQEDTPFSLVDMMKPYNYLYDVIHDRLNKLIAKNWGKLIQVDFAKMPPKWDVEKWLYFAKTTGIAVVDSFREGNKGAAQGKLAGALNNASSGVIDAEWGNTIQQHINLLEYIKGEMSEIVGITKQREGQISNRETVGGVERATLQSSHITDWIFSIHEDLKRRVLECLIETAKICLKGTSKKLQYILSDGTSMIMNIDGDEFAECDYGIVVDNSDNMQQLNQKLEMLAQAALQNHILDFSTIMKLYNSCSLSEKQHMVETAERRMIEQQQQQQQQQMEQQQQMAQMEQQMRQYELEMKDQQNIRDNETRIQVAEIQAMSRINDGVQEPEFNEESQANLMEKIREFDEKIKLEREKLNVAREKNKKDAELRLKAINKPKSTTT